MILNLFIFLSLFLCPLGRVLKFITYRFLLFHVISISGYFISAERITIVNSMVYILLYFSSSYINHLIWLFSKCYYLQGFLGHFQGFCKIKTIFTIIIVIILFFFFTEPLQKKQWVKLLTTYHKLSQLQ